MNVKVGLETVVGVVPDTVVKAEDQAYLEPVIPDVLRGRMRFPNELRRLSDNDAAEILALEAAKKALDKAGLRPSDIDYIIANNCGGKYTVPMVGGYVHWKLGFPQEVTALNIQSACASFVDGCEMAWNLILSGRYKRILVVMASAWDTSGGGGRTDFTDPMFSVMGDGAGAAIVSSQNLKCEFLSHYNRTFSEVYDLSGADVRSPAHPGLEGAPAQPQFAVYGYGTPEFFGWWQQVGPTFGLNGFNGALKKAGLTLDDLQMIIFHQPADMLYDVWMDGAEKAGVPRDIWKHTWDKYGNMSNAVVPVNLAEFWEKGELKKDMVMAWITIGAGGHAPTMIARWLV
jgi:3-oxoacyl-[acyl-carrier-protein] synthase-3